MTCHPFVEGLLAAEIRVLTCQACGADQNLDPLSCGICDSQTLVWRAATGVGRVYAITEVHSAPTAPFASLVPYTLVLVTMEGGTHLMGHAAPGLSIGDPVQGGVVEGPEGPLVRFDRRGRAND